MKRITLSSVILGAFLTAPVCVMADVQIGSITIKDDGRIVFSDNTEQSTATLQGPQGPQGPKGDPGTPGSQVTKEAICQVYADDGLPLPAFCGPKKVIFLTSARFDGNLGGLGGADQKCETAATTAGLTGTFKAWLSDSTTDAADRLTHSDTSYIRTDGAVIATNWFDLTDGSLKEPIMCDENRTCSVLGDYTWTGSTRAGKKTTSYLCSDWTNASSGSGTNGATSIISSAWSDYGTGNCSSTLKLYCIQQ